MDMLVAMRCVLGVRVVVIMRMVVMVSGLECGREEKLGMNVSVCPALVIVVKRSDLRLAEKAQEPGKDRESDATELSLVPVRQQSDAFLCLRCSLLYERRGGVWMLADSMYVLFVLPEDRS